MIIIPYTEKIQQKIKIEREFFMENNKNLEIERKYLIKNLPNDLEHYPHKKLEQGYLCTSPVVRIRRQEDEYILTYKGGGMMARCEYNLPLSKEGYEHLKEKVDGYIISKTRYYIPLDKEHTIELDIFEPPFAPLYLAEVEFSSIEEAESFLPPQWFDRDVTFDGSYHNSAMSQGAHIKNNP